MGLIAKKSMATVTTMAVLLLAAFAPPVTTQETLPSCEHGVLDATNRGLTSVPDPLICGGEAPVNLDMMNNNIGKLKAGSFTYNGYSRVILLNLSHCNVTGIERRAFEGANTLRVIDLSHNNLRLLEVWYFELLQFLKTLTLHDCRLESIKPEHFGEWFGRLQSLDLSLNEMTYLPRLVFARLTNLRSLILSENRLETLDPALFTANRKLNVIDLSDNNLNTIPRNIFTDLSNLRRLILSGNPLVFVSLELFSPTSQAIVLLANCTLTSMPLLSSSDTSSAETIRVDISGNPIQCSCDTAEGISRINCFDGMVDIILPCLPSTVSDRMSTIDPEVLPPGINDGRANRTPSSPPTVQSEPMSTNVPEDNRSFENLNRSPSLPTVSPGTNSLRVDTIILIAVIIGLLIIIVALFVDRRKRIKSNEHNDRHTSADNHYETSKNTEGSTSV